MPIKMQTGVVSGRQTTRRPRRPQHTFQVRARPMQVQPIMIAPVIPGETLKNLLLQARVVTDPIKNPLIGWWQEYYFFYIKHRDLYDRDILVQMMLDPDHDMSSLDSATQVETYHTNGSETAINWPLMCLERVVDEYFRFEGENMATAMLGNLPLAPLANGNILDSAINEASIEETAYDPNVVDAGSEFGTAARASEIIRALRAYELSRIYDTNPMTYEDFLRSYGISLPKEELHRPELIRYLRDWSYPTNTIDPTNGTPRSAVSWAIAERADKDRFFREPGFIFGVTVTRPKLYFKNLNSHATMLMKSARTWLPAIMSNDPGSSFVKVTAADPPLDINTDAYLVDVKDILIHGDQFLNFAMTATDANIVDLPSAALQKRYVSSADLDALFVAASPANQVRQDGVVSMSILSSWEDTSPTSVGTNITV